HHTAYRTPRIKPRSASINVIRLRTSHHTRNATVSSIAPKAETMNCSNGPVSTQAGTLRTAQYNRTITTPGQTRGRRSAAGGGEITSLIGTPVSGVFPDCSFRMGGYCTAARGGANVGFGRPQAAQWMETIARRAHLLVPARSMGPTSCGEC